MANPDKVITNEFTMHPNPATFNAAVKGLVTSLPPNESYNIQVIAPDGAMVYNTTAIGYEFEFNADFAPGVYFVNVKNKSYSGFKKLVIVK